MASKVGTLIKQARTDAGLTQEQLARKAGGGLTAADISKAERGEADLPVAALKNIAKATGVTQSSLVNAAKGVSKPAAAPKAAAKKAAAPKDPSGAAAGMRLTAAEKKLVEAYRKADSDTKKAAVNVLEGKGGGLLPSLLGGESDAGQAQGSVADLISEALGSLLGNK